jgi:MFS family permease
VDRLHARRTEPRLPVPTGLVVGGLLTDAYGYDVAFAVAGVTGLLAAVVAFLVLPDVSPDVGKLGGVYNVFGDLGSTLGPLVALPLVARVGFAAESLTCVVLALGVAVLVSRTLLGDATPTDTDCSNCLPRQSAAVGRLM